jgi:catechol 2,3-dioxygenase-like lactoylglutathione lyase family enzyme
MTILHHVAVITRDLERSRQFYAKALGCVEIARPAFQIDGAWLELGGAQIHLILHPQGSFRQSPVVDLNDVHFALRVVDFEVMVERLISYGFSEDAPDGDVKRLVTRRQGVAGFPQAYLLDPDLNIVEVNAQS